MRAGIWSAAFLCSWLTMPASQARAVEVWQGEAVILQASGCNAPANDERRNVGVGTVVKSVLRPRLVSDNGNDTRVSFTHDSGALMAIVLPGGAMPAATSAAFGATHSGLIVANRGVDYIGFAQTPRTITSDDVFVRLTGSLEDFLFIDGCSVTFRATYTKRPAE
ncbi:MAG TPA: hypothetical protein VFD92_06095 [Candidatus Binatia bacterium]|nr:hypothetical protein [Candidatus Binatia bacterium]